jgi:uncharacterized protein
VIFEWDEAKARSNLAKHGVAFEVGERVWGDPAHLLLFDCYDGGEERWQAIGLVKGVMILTVVHTYRGDDDEIVRIIGARRATLDERRRYDAQND